MALPIRTRPSFPLRLSLPSGSFHKPSYPSSHVRLFAIPWTVAYQAPLSMEFSRREYWSGLPFPSPGDLPNPGIEPRCPALQADALPSELPGKRLSVILYIYTHISQYHAYSHFSCLVTLRSYLLAGWCLGLDGSSSLPHFHHHHHHYNTHTYACTHAHTQSHTSYPLYLY